MKNFVKKIIFTLIILVITIITLGKAKIFFHEKINFNRFSRTIILGDSHSQAGINGGSLNMLNFSISGEPIVSSFIKLKKIIREERIDTVILGVGPHSFSLYQDYKFFDKRFSNGLLMNYFNFDEITIDKRLKISKLDLYLAAIKSQINFTQLNNPVPYQREINENLIIDSMSIQTKAKTRAKLHFFETEGKPSLLQGAYLDSIISLCKINEIELYLADVPVTKSYSNLIPYSLKLELNKNINKIPSNNIIRTNYIYNDSLFYDSDHLNNFGSKKYTKFLFNSIKKISLNDF